MDLFLYLLQKYVFFKIVYDPEDDLAYIETNPSVKRNIIQLCLF